MDESIPRGTLSSGALNASSAECTDLLRMGVPHTTAAAAGLASPGRMTHDVPPAMVADPPGFRKARQARELANSAVVPVRSAANVQRPNAVDDIGIPNSTKRARRDRGPNWSPQEISALIQAKRDLFFEELDAKDSRHLKKTETSKWANISAQVMKAGFSSFPRDGSACKAKWTLVSNDYKRVADFFCKSGSNGPDYWIMSAKDRCAEGLPRSFPEDVFYSIHYWFGNRPSMAPPHSRDLLSTEDKNYNSSNDGACNVDLVNAMDEETEVRMDDFPTGPVQSFDCRHASSPESTPTPHAVPASSVPEARIRTTCRTSRHFTSLPPGVTPVDLSSNDTVDTAARRRPANTGVRRKHLSGHTIIAEATKATGVVMAEQMKNMADATQQLERTKLEAQRKLFDEQIQYHKDRDLRMQENARVANENAKLAIIKQREVVQCLSKLADVLTAGMLSNHNLTPSLSPPQCDRHKLTTLSTSLPTSTAPALQVGSSGGDKDVPTPK